LRNTIPDTKTSIGMVASRLIAHDLQVPMLRFDPHNKQAYLGTTASETGSSLKYIASFTLRLEPLLKYPSTIERFGVGDFVDVDLSTGGVGVRDICVGAGGVRVRCIGVGAGSVGVGGVGVGAGSVGVGGVGVGAGSVGVRDIGVGAGSVGVRGVGVRGLAFMNPDFEYD
jgi:hypothetical protein